MKQCRTLSLKILTILFFTPSLSIHAVCPVYNPVDPQTGENIWRIASRTGTAIDDIGYTTSLCCDCTCFITQADVPNLIIDQPGVYCLAENIILDGDGVFSAVINVQSDNVVIDFRGRSITALASFDHVVRVNGYNNVLITDGFITTTEGPQGITVQSSNNVRISNLDISCTSGAPLSINGSTEVVVESCIVHDSIGQSFFTGCNSCVVKDCHATRIGYNGAAIGAFELQSGCSGIVFTNCTASQNLSIGFNVQGCSNIAFNNCYAHANGENGFIASNNSSNITFSDCQASNNTLVGFSVLNSCSNIAFNNCYAYANGADGFVVNNTSSKVTFSDCQANSNTLDGFEIEGQYSCAKNCIAMNNGAHGFRTNTAALATNFITVIGCTAKDNTGIGILNGGGPTQARIYNNIASDNTADNYLNVPVGILIAPAAVTSTTGFWANIDG